MPISNYAIIKGTPVAGKIFAPHSDRDQPHYHIDVQASGDFDIAVNIQSTDGSEVLYYVANTFTPPNVAGLTALASGITHPTRSSNLALDFVRVKGLVTRDQMTLLPIDETIANSAMHSQIDTLVQKAIQQKATIYAFGQSFGNTNAGSRNPFFGFSPDQGGHDIHMNQGNPSGSFGRDNGTFQDGALFIEWADGTWSAVFIAFQSQSFNTDDNGNQIG